MMIIVPIRYSVDAIISEDDDSYSLRNYTWAAIDNNGDLYFYIEKPNLQIEKTGGSYWYNETNQYISRIEAKFAINQVKTLIRRLK